MAAISYDSPEILAAFSRQQRITFPLLSDVSSSTIGAFGIRNPAADWAFGPDKDDPAVVTEIQKYVAVAGVRPFASMVGIRKHLPLPTNSSRVRANLSRVALF